MRTCWISIVMQYQQQIRRHQRCQGAVVSPAVTMTILSVWYSFSWVGGIFRIDRRQNFKCNSPFAHRRNIAQVDPKWTKLTSSGPRVDRKWTPLEVDPKWTLSGSTQVDQVNPKWLQGEPTAPLGLGGWGC